MTLQDCFVGVTSFRTYQVCHAIEWGHAYIGTASEFVLRFEGVPDSLAFSTGSHTLTDANGRVWTVNLDPVMTMSSTNPPHPAVTNSVSRTRRSPHLYDIEVTYTQVTDGLTS